MSETFEGFFGDQVIDLRCLIAIILPDQAFHNVISFKFVIRYYVIWKSVDRQIFCSLETSNFLNIFLIFKIKVTV